MTAGVRALHRAAAGSITDHSRQSIVVRESLGGAIGDVWQARIVAAALERKIPVDDVGGDQSSPVGPQAVHFERQIFADSLLHAREAALRVSVAKACVDERQVGKIAIERLALQGSQRA